MGYTGCYENICKCWGFFLWGGWLPCKSKDFLWGELVAMQLSVRARGKKS